MDNLSNKTCKNKVMALAAVRSKAVDLLLLIAVDCYQCFALFVFLMSRDCCVALPHDVMGLSAVYGCGIS